jgi:hypothetical protein
MEGKKQDLIKGGIREGTSDSNFKAEKYITEKRT